MKERKEELKEIIKIIERSIRSAKKGPNPANKSQEAYHEGFYDSLIITKMELKARLEGYSK